MVDACRLSKELSSVSRKYERTSNYSQPTLVASHLALFVFPRDHIAARCHRVHPLGGVLSYCEHFVSRQIPCLYLSSRLEQFASELAALSVSMTSDSWDRSVASPLGVPFHICWPSNAGAPMSLYLYPSKQPQTAETG